MSRMPRDNDRQASLHFQDNGFLDSKYPTLDVTTHLDKRIVGSWKRVLSEKLGIGRLMWLKPLKRNHGAPV